MIPNPLHPAVRETLGFPGEIYGRYMRSLSHGVSRTLFSVRVWPWLVFEFLVICLLFRIGAFVSPYGASASWDSALLILDLVFASSFCAIGLGLGLYDRDHRFNYRAAARDSLLALVLAALLSLMVHYFVFYELAGRLILGYAFIVSLAGVLLIRAAVAWAFRWNPYCFTVIGESECIKAVIAHCEANGKAYSYVPWTDLVPQDRFATANAFTQVRDVVVATEAADRQEAADLVTLAIQAKLRVVDEHVFYAHTFRRMRIDDLSPAWVAEQVTARQQNFQALLKRIADVVLAAIALVILSPIVLLIALSIKLSDGGPVFFNQTRQGLYSQPFRMYKFRTMRIEQSDVSARGGFTRPNDVRITRLGRLLRRAHLDELPQLLNILMGDMSLVGPRPEAFDFAARMSQELPLYELRYLVRPGLTGHAQLNQGYALDNVTETKAKLSYDFYYLCYHSIWMDLQIMFRTALFLTRRAQ